MTVLNELGKKYGTDKGSNSHDYLHFYEMLFSKFRDHPITFLEIGLGGGNVPSLCMWRDFFPLGKIIGIDNTENCMCDTESRIHTFLADQKRPEEIKDIAEKHGPFHIVLDDASHECQDQLSSFEVLRDHIVPGGMYVIEDMINDRVADYVSAIAREVTFDNTGATSLYKSLCVFRGTAVIGF